MVWSAITPPVRSVDAEYSVSIEIGLGTGHEEGACLMQPVQEAKVDIPSIHKVDGTSLGYQHIERVHIVQLAVRDMDKARNVAAQIEQSMHLHRRFVDRKCAHENTDKQRSMVVESSA